MTLLKHRNMTPARIILLGFLALIGVGTVLLMLPFASREPGGASFLDALFTATSATCVTGLVVQDTALYWSGFGQAVILFLIQVGGMGVVTMAMTIVIFTGQKISLRDRWVMQESISAPQVGGIIRLTRFILQTLVWIELAGTALLAIRFIPQLGVGKGLWYALFHSVSAFCNAGFDLMGTEGAAFSSLTAFRSDPIVNGTIMLLIVLGGLGFFTWQDLRDHGFHWKLYMLQTKLILIMTGVLLVGGALYFFLYELRLPQWNGLNLWEKVQAALFQSVTCRTAGFNTLDLTKISEPGLLLMIVLMMVGGSPTSTAGGFKTTTLAVLLMSARASFQRRENAQCFGRRLPNETVRNASAILILYLILILTGSFLISCADGLPILTALFEAGSAVATVGLSVCGTPGLSDFSHIVLIVLMYVGRVGGLTLFYGVITNGGFEVYRYPEENVTVG